MNPVGAQRPNCSPRMRRGGSRRTLPSCRSCCVEGDTRASFNVRFSGVKRTSNGIGRHRAETGRQLRLSSRMKPRDGEPNHKDQDRDCGIIESGHGTRHPFDAADLCTGKPILRRARAERGKERSENKSPSAGPGPSWDHAKLAPLNRASHELNAENDAMFRAHR